MKILILDDHDADAILAWVQEPRLRDKLIVQLDDPLLGGAGYPRTLLIRDEGVRPLLMASFDRGVDADLVWNQMAASGADRLALDAAVCEEGDIDWPR